MAERYTRLYALTENLYQSGAPVLIAAGALLKDNQTNRALAQIKLQSLSDKPIKAAKVTITPLDVIGNKLGSLIEHQYLDLNIQRDEEFGTKSPIYLPDATTRAFRAAVTSVVFADNTVWSASEAAWEPLPAPVVLDEVYPDAEMRKQFKLEFGSRSQYAYAEFADLCRCPCGALNRQDEAKCHVCGCNLLALRGLDITELEKRKDERLEQEKRAEEERQERGRIAKEKAAVEAKERTKKRRKNAIIATMIVCVMVAFLFVLHKINVRGAMPEGLDTAKVGDSVFFGSYEQDGKLSNGKESIEWVILEIQEDRALLLSKYILDSQPYNEERTDVTWATCTLRKWLNSYFLNEAFSSAEKAWIPTVTVSADKNSHYSTDPGKDTRDKVFLLSFTEARKYLASSISLGAKLGDYTDYDYNKFEYHTATWMLRTPGEDQNFVTYAWGSDDGSYNISWAGGYVSMDEVRPAIWVKLKK